MCVNKTIIVLISCANAQIEAKILATGEVFPMRLSTISKYRRILCLRTEFIYTTHNSLYAVKEFLSIVVLLLYALDFLNFLFSFEKYLLNRSHVVTKRFSYCQDQNTRPLV